MIPKVFALLVAQHTPPTASASLLMLSKSHQVLEYHTNFPHPVFSSLCGGAKQPTQKSPLYLRASGDTATQACSSKVNAMQTFLATGNLCTDFAHLAGWFAAFSQSHSNRPGRLVKRVLKCMHVLKLSWLQWDDCAMRKESLMDRHLMLSSLSIFPSAIEIHATVLNQPLPGR